MTKIVKLKNINPLVLVLVISTLKKGVLEYMTIINLHLEELEDKALE